MKIEDVLSRLDGVRQSGGGFSAKCPAHNDKSPSLSLKEESGKILMNCFAGCDFASITEALGLSKRDFFTETNKAAAMPEADEKKLQPLTRKELESIFKIPWTFFVEKFLLQEARSQDGIPYVSTPFMDETGSIIAIQKRFGNGKRFRKGDKLIIPYGVYGLPPATTKKILFIVEGASDVWVLRFNGFCVIGLPGASCGNLLKNSPLLQGWERIIFLIEPDSGGETLLRTIQKIEKWPSPVFTMTLPNHKDAAELWVKNPDSQAFHEKWEKAVNAAKPLECDQESDEVRLQSFDSITPQSAKFAVEGKIPSGSISVIAGKPGEGKTTVVISIVAQLSRGTMPGDWYGTPVHVVIASCEDSPSATLRPRLEAAGADLSRVHVVTTARDGIDESISIPTDLAGIEKAMKDVDARVLVVDPVMGHLGEVDSYKDQSVRKALAPLAAMAEKLDAAIIGIMHLNKRDCASIATRVGGSVGFVAAARSVLLTANDPDSEESSGRVLVHAKCNLAPLAPTIRYRIESATYMYDSRVIETSRVVWGETVNLKACDVLRPETSGGDELNQKAEAKNWLKAFLGEGPKPAEEVFQRGDCNGFTKSTLKRAKRELGIISEKSGFTSAQWVWALPSKSAEEDQDCLEGSHHLDSETLRASHCKKSKNSNNLVEGDQGSGVEPLRGESESLRGEKDGNVPSPWKEITTWPEEVVFDAD